MTGVELPTCAASPYRARHHERQWRILEGLSLLDGTPLAIAAGDAWDLLALRNHGLVRFGRSRDGLQVVELTDDGRALLASREAERAHEIQLADVEAKR